MSFNAAEIDQQESTLILPTFTSQTAYALGTSIRSLIQKTHPGSPAVIAIFAGSTSQLYFFATAAEGTQPDNMEWVERKRRSVVRWMKSTAALRCKFGSNGPPAQYGTPEELYASHGGGFPLRIKGLETLAGVAVVSGLAQEDDHKMIVESLKAFLKEEQK